MPAGLTHGGFYRRFASRDELVAAGIERALRDGANGAFDAETHSKLGKRASLFALIGGYLSPAHRDGSGSSCAVASRAADVSRSNERSRSAYTRQASAYLDLFVRLIESDESSKFKRTKVVAAWATLVGAVSTARAVNDDTLSSEILKAAADQIKAQLG